MTKLIFLVSFLVPLLCAGSGGGFLGGGGGGATWGSITGTLSAQTDLNTALGLKAPLASPTFTGAATASGASGRFITSANFGTSSAPVFGFDDGVGNFGGFLFPNSGARIEARVNNDSSSTTLYLANTVIAAHAPRFSLDVDGTGADVTFATGSATGTGALTSDPNGGTTTSGAGVKVYGHSNGTPDITEFWNASVLTAKMTATNQVQFPNLASSSAATTGTVCWTTPTGNLTVDTTTTCLPSTRKIKKDIDPLDVGLDLVMKLKPVSYSLRRDQGEGRQIGLVAEDVAEVEKRLVAMDDKGEPRSVRYQQLTAVLVKAVQQQQRQIEELKRELQELK